MENNNGTKKAKIDAKWTSNVQVNEAEIKALKKEKRLAVGLRDV